MPKIPSATSTRGRFCIWLDETGPVRAFAAPGGLGLLLTRAQEFLELQHQYESRLALGVTPAYPGPAINHVDEGRRQWLDTQRAALWTRAFADLGRATTRAFNSNARCPCGSGRRVARCHRRMLTSMIAAWNRNPAGRDQALQYLEEHR